MMHPSTMCPADSVWFSSSHMANKQITVTLAKSLAGQLKNIQASVRGLGLRRLNSVSELQDTPAVRGMINKVSYLVKVIS